MTRFLRLATGFGAAVLLVGQACSDDQDGNRAAVETTATSAGGPGGSATTASTTSVPGPGSGTPGAGAAAADAGGTGTVDAGTAGTVTKADPKATTAALRANLTGEAEVPDRGLAGGTGVATLQITGMQMCYRLEAPIAEKPILAHIHEGAAGEAGDVVINFEVVFTRTPSAFVAEKCLNKDPALLAGIVANPAGFYVNIHTGEHPRGAVRGQLEPSS